MPQSELLHAQRTRDWQLEADVLGRMYRVRRRKPVKDPLLRFFGKLAFGAPDCWYWVGARHKLGYGLLPMLGESKAHRVSWRLYHGAIPEGMSVLHKCDVRCCVNPHHLFLGTQTDNMRDMVSKGRGVTKPKFGEASHMSKLTAAQVNQIREAYAGGGTTMKKLASTYGVAVMTIQRAIARTSWRHL
jgi:hypothetical protein